MVCMFVGGRLFLFFLYMIIFHILLSRTFVGSMSMACVFAYRCQCRKKCLFLSFQTLSTMLAAKFNIEFVNLAESARLCQHCNDCRVTNNVWWRTVSKLEMVDLDVQ